MGYLPSFAKFVGQRTPHYDLQCLLVQYFFRKLLIFKDINFFLYMIIEPLCT